MNAGAFGRTAAVVATAVMACVVGGVSTSDAAPPFGCHELGGTVTCQYSYRAIEQFLVIPVGVTTVHVEATGGAGGAGQTQGGLGAATGGAAGTVSGDLAVTDNEALFIEVGGPGGAGTAGNGGAAGFNGGGAGGSFHGGGGGGGATDVRTTGCSSSCPSDATSLASRVLVAGGGGGGSGNGFSGSGNGGNFGSPGVEGFLGTASTGGAHPGGAGTTSAGGAGGAPNCGGVQPPNGEPGGDGALGQGGDGGVGFPFNGGVGNNSAAAGGGGGGGGYYGGGGGASAGNQTVCGAAGGGGGSSWGDPGVTNESFGTAPGGASPQVTITFPAPPGLGKTYYVAPGGAGADSACLDNSQANPYAQITSALNCAGDGDVVSVAPSATPYEGIGAVNQSITIEAAFPSTARDVKVDLSEPNDVAGTVTVAAGKEADIENLTLDCVGHNCAKPSIINHGALTLRGDTITGAGTEVAVQNESDGTHTATLNVLGSTIAHNVNSGGSILSQGGGIEVDGSPTPTVTIANSTLVDNAAELGGLTSGSGGGIYAASGSSVTVTNSTVSGNSANGAFATGGGIFVADGADSGTVKLANSILDANTATSGAADCQGAVSSTPAGHNVVGDSSGCPQLFGTSGNQLGVADAGLGTLGDHGGPTDTVALLGASPAIGAGDEATCASTNVGGVDQRGAPRNAGTRGVCDAGAYDSGADTTAPAIAIATPTDGGHYPQGAALTAAYSCSDLDGSDEVETCAGQQEGTSVAKGGTLDTATAGDHSFTVQTTDWDGNTASKTVTYTVDAPSAGGGGGPGPGPGGTTPTAPGGGQSVAAAADIALSGRLSTKHLRAGGRGTYRLTARNRGPGTATKLVLSATLPRQLRVVSVRKVHGGRCTRHGRKITCRFGSLAAGKTVHVSIVVKAARSGRGHVVLRGSAHEHDPNVRNNKLSTKTAVLRRAR
jgi:uncharacterized repeat protein (TIGR01451 family)